MPPAAAAPAIAGAATTAGTAAGTGAAIGAGTAAGVGAGAGAAGTGAAGVGTGVGAGLTAGEVGGGLTAAEVGGGGAVAAESAAPVAAETSAPAYTAGPITETNLPESAQLPQLNPVTGHSPGEYAYSPPSSSSQKGPPPSGSVPQLTKPGSGNDPGGDLTTAINTEKDVATEGMTWNERLSKVLDPAQKGAQIMGPIKGLFSAGPGPTPGPLHRESGDPNFQATASNFMPQTMGSIDGSQRIGAYLRRMRGY